MNSDDAIHPEEQKPKHSGFGIASFVMSLANVLLICVFYVIYFNPFNFLSGFHGWGGFQGWGGLVMMIVVSYIAFLLVGIISLVGFILGLVAIGRQNCRKFFGILGMVLNGLPPLVFLLMKLYSSYDL